jgi:hypothetical protein
LRQHGLIGRRVYGGQELLSVGNHTGGLEATRLSRGATGLRAGHPGAGRLVVALRDERRRSRLLAGALDQIRQLRLQDVAG